MTIEEAALADLVDRAGRIVSEPDMSLEPEEIELIISGIKQHIWKLERMCNAIIGRPGGLDRRVLSSLQLMKVLTAQLRWHLDQSKPAEASIGIPSPG